MPIPVRTLLACAVLVAGCASAGTSAPARAQRGPTLPPSAETARTGPPRRIQVAVVHAAGAPVAATSVRLLELVDGSARQRGEPVTTDALGRATVDAAAPGTFRVALEGVPGVAFGWLRRGVHAHFVDVAIAADEQIGHGVRLVAPRPGALEVRVSRAGIPADERVIVALRRRYPSGDLLSRHDSNNRPEPIRDDARGIDLWRWDELPEGRYVIRVWSADTRTGRFFAADVAPGATNIVDVSPAPPGPRLVIEYAGPPPDTAKAGRLRLDLNPTDGGASLVRGMLDDGPLRSRGAAPGEYLAILDHQKAAMAVVLPDIGADRLWRVRLAPPSWLQPATAGATVRVRVLRGHARAGGFVALAPPAHDHLVSGSWLRLPTSGNRFDGVPPGDWDVVVLNGVYETRAGLPRQTVHRVRVAADDLDVTIRVPEE